jgi:hypothetical protein
MRIRNPERADMYAFYPGFGYGLDLRIIKAKKTCLEELDIFFDGLEVSPGS